MSFGFTKEQLMVQKTVREFSRKVVAVTASERDKTKKIIIVLGFISFKYLVNVFHFHLAFKFI